MGPSHRFLDDAISVFPLFSKRQGKIKVVTPNLAAFDNFLVPMIFMVGIIQDKLLQCLAIFANTGHSFGSEWQTFQ